MAHFAKIEDGLVTEVMVVHNSIVDPEDSGSDNEQLGKDFIASLNIEGTWVQTSYNGNIRKQYGQPGWSYDSTADKFVSPAPYASWTLDSTIKNWKAPITKPTLTEEQITQGKDYVWNESAYQANNLTGWDLMDNPY